MKYYIIAGEASGDLHGSNLMRELRDLDNKFEVRFWGGDQMSQFGYKPIKHIKELAFMGFAEVILNIRTIFKNISFCKSDLLAYKPDVLILIDYPGFNLRIAEFAKKHNIKVQYYISPQIWAWKQNRVHKIKKVVDKMYSILPFEKEFYKKFEMDIEYVGHPLVDAIHNYQNSKKDDTDFYLKNNLSNKPILALLPGSRNQEIKTKLPIMLGASKSFEDYQIIIAGAPNKNSSFYKEYLEGKDVKIIENQTYDILNNASLAMVTSGTATLETALFKVPQVVCYKANKISYQIAKRLIKIKYISLVNLIIDKEIVKELIQEELTVKNLVLALKNAELNKTQMINSYNTIEEKLGGGGASKKVAQSIYTSLLS